MVLVPIREEFVKLAYTSNWKWVVTMASQLAKLLPSLAHLGKESVAACRN